MVRSCLAARLSRRVGSVLRPFSGRFRSVVSLAPALPSGPPRSAEPLVPGFWQVSMRTKQERGRGWRIHIFGRRQALRRCRCSTRRGGFAGHRADRGDAR